MDVRDGAAAVADEVMVGVLPGRLEIGAVAAEIGTQEQALVDEQVEGAIDRGGVDTREVGPHRFDDVVGAEVLVGLGRERLPDQPALARQPASTGMQLYRRCRELMSVLVCGRGCSRHGARTG